MAFVHNPILFAYPTSVAPRLLWEGVGSSWVFGAGNPWGNRGNWEQILCKGDEAEKLQHVVIILLILEINHYASQVQSATTYYHTSMLRTQRFSTLFLTVPLAI